MGDQIRKRLQIAPEGGYTSGSGSVYNGGSAVTTATRRLAVEQSLSADVDITFESAKEARGAYAGVYQHTEQERMGKGKLSALIYADDLYYLNKMSACGSPTFVTLPNTPAVLLAATAIASTMPALTTQPNAAGDGALAKIIQITLSNASTSTTAVIVTINGTDINNLNITDTCNFTSGTQTLSATGGGAGALSCTLWTSKYFKTVTSITCSATPASDLVAVSGLNGFLYTYPLDMTTSTLLSMSGQYYDGSAAWLIPGMVMEKLSYAMTMGKSSKVDGTFSSQDKIPLAANVNSINPSAQNGDYQALTSLADAAQLYAIGTGLARFYADPMGVAPGTTLLNSRLLDYKVDLDMAVKLGKAADGTLNPSFVGRDGYGDKLIASLTLLWNSLEGNVYDPNEVNSFLTAASRTSRMAFVGPYLPCGPLSATGGWPAALQDGSSHGGAYGIMFDMAGKYTKMTEKGDSGRAAYAYTVESEVDLVTMGTPLICSLISRINPNL